MRPFVSLLSMLLIAICSSAARAQDDVGLRFIPPSATAAVLIKPREIQQSPLLAALPWEVVSTESKAMFGIASEEIVSVLAFAEPPGEDGQPRMGTVVKFASPVEIGQLMPDQQKRGVMTLQKMANGDQQYLRAPDEFPLEIWLVDDTTAIAGLRPAIEAMRAQADQPAGGPLVSIMRGDEQSAEMQAFLVMEPIRELAQFVLSEPQLLQRWPGLDQLAEDLKHLELSLDMDPKQGGLTLVLTGNSPEEAAALQQTTRGLLDATAAQIAATAKANAPDAPQSEAVQRYLVRLTGMLRQALEPTVEGNQVKLTTVGNPDVSPQFLAAGTLMLMPAIATTFDSAYRMNTSNDLKQIMLAMHNYHDTFGRFPPRASRDADGKPLLSWRVHLLPFLEQAPLHQQFRLDEPWDSEHNRKLIAQVPPPYQSDRDRNLTAEGKTRYLWMLGEGLPGSVEGDLMFRDLTDGTSNTLAVVEAPADKAVVWTKPDDLGVDLENPLESLLGRGAAGFNAARYDGSVSFYRKTIKPLMLKYLLTHAGGEVVSERELYDE